MQYKTIVFQLLEQHSELHARLCKSRMLLAALDQYAMELKASHEAWKDRLSLTRPGSSAEQIASEALEMSIKALEERLPSESPPEEDDLLSLELPMATLRPPTRPA